MKQKMIFGLHACTSIHAGAGSSTGVIDLPIQREGHTGWPCVFGSAMKGALRAHAESRWGKTNGKVLAMFGPDTQNAAQYAGALMISDARLLLLPVRSLTSQFKWLTCEAVLSRFTIDSQRFGAGEFEVPRQAAELSEEEALVPEQSAASALFLEEYRFDPVAIDLSTQIKKLASLMPDTNHATAALQRQLVIVSNDMFAHLSAHTTPVNPHIAIDSDTGTVVGGALWFEETLPPETVLYTGVHAAQSRLPREREGQKAGPQHKPDQIDSAKMAENFRALFSEDTWLQVGANETVGMGWVSVRECGV